MQMPLMLSRKKKSKWVLAAGLVGWEYVYTVGEEGNTGKSFEDFVSSISFRKCINQIRGIYVSPAVLSGSAVRKEVVKEKPSYSSSFKYIPHYY